MDEEDLNKLKNIREGIFWAVMGLLYFFVASFVASFFSIFIYMFKDLYSGALTINGFQYFYNGEPLDYVAYSIRTSALNTVLMLPLIILGFFIFCKIKKIKFRSAAASYKLLSGRNILGLIAGIALLFPISFIISNSFIGELSPEINSMIDEIIESTPFWLSFFALAICGPIQEELLMRGFVQGRLMDSGLKPNMVILIQASLFGIMHMNLQQFFYTIVLGIIFGIMRHLSKSIWPCIFAHIGFNGISILIGKDWTITKWLSNIPDFAMAAIGMVIFAVVFYTFEIACKKMPKSL